MNFPSRLILWAALFRAASFFAQENTPADTSGQILPANKAAAAPASSPSPSPVATPPELMLPDLLPPLGTIPPVESPISPELEQLNQIFKQSTLGQAADEYRLHEERRRVENQLVNDPDVQAAKAFAEAAPTDFEKRKRLRSYYELYYQKMNARAEPAELKASLSAFKNAHIGPLEQPKVRPDTVAWTPSTPNASPTPTPAKKRKKHHDDLR
ncbi:MAG TPA: hypothetical protein VIL70_02580 [Chthoniobacterales bacterium]